MSPRSKQPDDAALLRYVSGESPLAESQQVEEWLAADADLRASVAELRAAWGSGEGGVDVGGARAPEWDKAGVWRGIAAEMKAPRMSGPRKIAGIGRSRAWTTYAIAASMLLVIGASTLVMWKRDAREREVAAARTWREVVTTRGQQAVLDLADGSRVTLAAETRLRIPSDFAVRRELELIGRAHFSVVHDTTRAFVVHTATATTEDIGTAFVVTEYAGAAKAQVVVTEGSVAIGERSSKRLMTLERGDVATLDSAGTATLTRNVDVERYASWTKGVLSIDNMRLADAIPELERWYDVEIRLGDARLGERRVTAQLRAEPAARAAERLARALGVRAVNREGVITLR